MTAHEFLSRKRPGRFDAHTWLRRRHIARRAIPFTPIAAFGLPFDESFSPLPCSGAAEAGPAASLEVPLPGPTRHCEGGAGC